MAATFVPAIDIQNYARSSQGLDLHAISYIGTLHAAIDSSSVDRALDFLSQNTGRFSTILEVTSVSSIDDVVSLLDAGAARIVISEQQGRQLQQFDNIDGSRIVLACNDQSSSEVTGTTLDAGVALRFANLDQALNHQKNSQHNPRPGAVFVQIDRPDKLVIEKAIAASTIPIVPATALTIDSKNNSQLISVADLLLANAETDRADGLFTTLVTDERDVALGLVYSSKESLAESLRTGRGVYQSRKRGLWYKGESSGDVQELVRISLDCDSDCLRFMVRQKGRGIPHYWLTHNVFTDHLAGFCHLATATCFGPYRGLSRLQQTLRSRKESAPAASYTQRLFQDPDLLNAKIKEEASELCDAKEQEHIAFEAADLFYFTLTKCIAAGVSLEDLERNLDAKSTKVKRRKGDAKPSLNEQKPTANGKTPNGLSQSEHKEYLKEAASNPKAKSDPAGKKDGRIAMTRYITADSSPETIEEVLKRPSQRSSEMIMGIVKPIIDDVRVHGDTALLSYTHKFEKALSLKSPVLKAPFPPELMRLSAETVEAVDISFENIRRFHAAQKEDKPLSVETMPGVVCSRFSKPIERVGLYVPGGTAVLPSTALMLGVPAMVAGCKKIVLASPPRADGSLTPEVVYVAHKVGAESIVLAGGAQAVAAMAYGTESVTKVDKILGPGNQFVTAAKMLVSNDTTAGVSIDMPAGPSEVLVIADSTSNPAFVASDLLSQAEHGTDSQVILIAVGMSNSEINAVENELHSQASTLPRVDIVRGAIEHSVTLVVSNIEEAMQLSNQYAPEHLIIQSSNPEAAAMLVENAGSVFIGPWTPESVGDYSAGVNHSLPTYGYARQYSGVNLASYVKHITSSQLTQEGLRNVGGAVMQLAKVEELEAHRRAVSIRLGYMDRTKTAS